MSNIPDAEYCQLYELFKSLMGDDTPDSQKVVIYHPELFINMAQEIVKLRKENYSLRVANGSMCMDREYANRLAEQLKEIKEYCDVRDIHLPFKFR